MLARRGLLRGLLAAPAVVAASSLMPVRVPLWTPDNPSLMPIRGIAQGLRLGDLITFAGVEAKHRLTGRSTGQLRQFVVTGMTEPGAREVPIYPVLSSETVVNPWFRALPTPTLVAAAENHQPTMTRLMDTLIVTF